MNKSQDNRSWGGIIAKGTFLVLTLAMLVGVIYILRSVLHAVILGALFAMLLMPLHELILRWVERVFRWCRRGKTEEVDERILQKRHKRHRSIASALLVGLVCIVVVVPLGMFATSVVHQGYVVTGKAQRWVTDELPGKIRSTIEEHHLQERMEKWTAWYQQFSSGELFAEKDAAPVEKDAAPVIQPATETAAPEAGTNSLGPEIARLATKVMQFLRDTLLSLLSQAGIVTFNFCVMLFVMYQFFYDGRSMLAYLKKISPLREEEQQRVETRIREVVRAVFFGILGTAIAQGVCASICFKIADIPVFWGVLLGICSIVPVVGTSIVWIPVVLYLVLMGQYGWATFIFVSCGCVIANFDMLLRPLLMRRSGDTGMSYMVLFLSLLGGIQTFGLVGVIYGPMITGICSVCLLIFSTQFKERSQQDEQGEALEG